MKQELEKRYTKLSQEKGMYQKQFLESQNKTALDET